MKRCEVFYSHLPPQEKCDKGGALGEKIRKTAEKDGWLPLYEALNEVMRRDDEYATTEEYQKAAESIINQFAAREPIIVPDGSLSKKIHLTQYPISSLQCIPSK